MCGVSRRVSWSEAMRLSYGRSGRHLPSLRPSEYREAGEKSIIPFPHEAAAGEMSPTDARLHEK